ncbi:hypothetical protein ACIP5N_27615 [Streptomyces sp. NPDC088768]|uniref:DUF7574 domain-containing protein n=1 Tax=Streptomyces sp. NPDC088768 TaxID=3365894 RepID=UPI003807FF8B
MNVYNHPTAEGAQLLGSVDAGMGYEFDMLIAVVRLSDGALFMAEDRGCSCFSPFEGTTWDDMTPVTNGAEFARLCRLWRRQEDRAGRTGLVEDVERLIATVRRARKRRK